MCGGGGSNSSNSTTTQNVDKRLVVDNGVGVSSDSSTVTVTAIDHGAIEQSFQMGKAALDSIVTADANQGQTLDKIVGLADKLFTGGYDLLKTNQVSVNQAYETAKTLETSKGTVDNRTIIVLGVAAAAAYAATRRKAA